MEVFRTRVVLHATRLIDLPSHHAGVLYATTAAAYGHSQSVPDVFPDGFALDVPEQCRRRVAKGHSYAFGFTILATDAHAAARRLSNVVHGLEALGAHRTQSRKAFNGNFIVDQVEDLVANTTWELGSSLQPISTERFVREAQSLGELALLSLHVRSPLRMRRSKRMRRKHHAYFDRDCFEPGLFLWRLQQRLEALDLVAEDPRPYRRAIEVVENRLVWLDVGYGSNARRKTLGGAVGDISLRGLRPGDTMPVVLGQYAGAGLGTRFGFGRYRVAELGPEPFACRRARSLLKIAFGSSALDRVAEKHELPSGELRAAARDVQRGTYEPEPVMRYKIKPEGRRERALQVPRKRDQALHRLVHEVLVRGVDGFLESSSFAYRPGFGRGHAAKRIRAAYDDGYRWVVRSDFSRFFESVDHALLSDRLHAALACRPTARTVMDWIRSAMAPETVGLPTGSPLSPVLANLLLDQFDEAVERAGALLVRYADDFVILTKTEAEAQAMYAVAKSEASALRLQLNADKTAVSSLGSSVEFLGFRFQHQETWSADEGQPPVRTTKLGWQERKPVLPPRTEFELPGEVAETPSDAVGVHAVAGVATRRIDVSGSDLIATCQDGTTRTLSLARLRDVVLLGPPAISRRAIRALMRAGVVVELADGVGRQLGTLSPRSVHRDAEVLAAQVRVHGDDERSMVVARTLINCKIRNYAALTRAALPGRRGGALVESMLSLAEKAKRIDDRPSLVGVEGSAARLWYEALNTALPSKWNFKRRVAPDATDPINVLLNLSHTFFHRIMRGHVRAAGLLPEIGMLHRPRPGHDALVSDLQEPFRHLADRAVLQLSHTMTRADFVRRDATLHLQRAAAKRVRLALHESLVRVVRIPSSSEPITYHAWMRRLCRGLRHHLLDPSTPLPEFLHL